MLRPSARLQMGIVSGWRANPERRPDSKGTVKLWMLVTLTIIVVSVLALYFSCPDRDRLLTDERLAGLLTSYAPQFDELLGMFLEDGRVSDISPRYILLFDDRSWPRLAADLGMSFERWDSYKVLMRRTRVKYGLRKTDPAGSTVLFIVSAAGFAGRGEEKGLAYRAMSPSVHYESLDTPPQGLGKNELAFRPLREGWYIYYRRHP